MASAFVEQPDFSVTLSNGQTDHYFLDSFTDPWRRTNEQPVVLIQPGFCRTGVFWYHWVPALARDYVVIRRDLRGHGRSSYPRRVTPWSEEPGRYEGDYAYDIQTICAEIVDFLDCLGISKVHFIGESTSGQIGHALAALHPDRVQSLTTCSTPTHLPKPKQQFLAMGQASWPEAIVKLGSHGWADALARQAGTAPRKNPEYQEWWLKEAGKSPADGLAGYAAFLSRLDTRPFLPHIKCPVLILAPTKSAAVPLEESEYAASHIPSAQLEIIDSFGHEIYAEAPEMCQALVKKHLTAAAAL